MDETALTQKELVALRHIRNILVHTGRTPSVRELMTLLGYSSPRAASYMIDKLEAKGYVDRNVRGMVRLRQDFEDEKRHAQTVDVPLVGSAPCGAPVMAEENIEAVFPVSRRLAPSPHRHFLVRAIGDSMDKAGIEDGDLVLVRQKPTAENREVVVALVDGEVTIKEFHRGEGAIVLKPNSKNREHMPIILTTDFQVLGVVKSIINFKES